MRLLLVALLLACGGPPNPVEVARDAGQRIETPDWLHQINTQCKKWELGTYFDLGVNEWVYFNYCTQW